MLALAVAAGVFAGTAYVGVRNIIEDHSASSPAPSSTPGDAEAAVRRAATGDAVLERLASAIQDGDRSAYNAVIDPDSAGFQDAAKQVYDNLRALPVASLAMRYVSDETLPAERRRQLGGTAWLADVEVSWQLREYDQEPVRMTVPMTLVTRSGTTYVASYSDPTGQTLRKPIWLLGRLRIAHGDRSLVVSTDPDADIGAYAQVVDKAIADVSTVWGSNWKRHVVLYLPGSQSQMEYILGVKQRTYGQIAAVTTAEAAQRVPGVPIRILVNPKLFARLTPQGRRIVLTHETTHVASNATASPVPMWLAEGFADYVAFSMVNVSVQSAANELFKAVRAGKGPTALPAPSAFAASSRQLTSAYESSWLACRMIADKYGRAKLVAFYRAVHMGDPVTGLRDAIRTRLGITQERFVADWRQYLQGLARQGAG